MISFLALASLQALAATAHVAGIRLEDLAWPEAEAALTEASVVVLPLGAAAKEHGPHLPLNNDLTMATWLADRVLDRSAVIVAPPISYSYYPAFQQYPGSTSVSLTTARDLIVDICRSLGRFGPRKFYVLNTGISTLRPLALAAVILASEHITLTYTDLDGLLGPVKKQVETQAGGSHADEIETSMMLYMAPHTVDMRRAVADYHPGDGPLTRDPNGPGTYSPTGTYGDPTLATRAKGEKLVSALLAGILRDIEMLRHMP